MYRSIIARHHLFYDTRLLVCGASAVHVQGNHVCDPDCFNSACDMDNWDCCEEGSLFDSRSGNVEGCCEPSPTTSVSFTLVSFGGKKLERNLESRLIGRNRVIGGILLHQTRQASKANTNRFKNLYASLPSGISEAQYGVNPYYFQNSALFKGEDSNKPAFIGHASDTGFGTGFPVYFDIGLTGAEAQELATYLSDGHYFDEMSKTLKIQIPIYNGVLDLFGDVSFVFTTNDAGQIEWTYKVVPVDVNPYDSTSDFVRMAFEIVYMISVLYILFFELKELYVVYVETGSVTGYFKSLWNYVDVLSISLNLASIGVRSYMVYYAYQIFNLNLFYTVYEPHYQR